MSAAEFAEWQAFDRLEPIGSRREDMRMAVLAALIANQWRGKETEPVTPYDMLKLLPWWDEKRERAAVNLKPVHRQDTPRQVTPHWTTSLVEDMWAEMQAALPEEERSHV